MSLPPFLFKSDMVAWYERRTGYVVPDWAKPLPDEQMQSQCRWPTAIYAAMATLVGFAFFEKPVQSNAGLVSLLVFIPLTVSVMLFNDFVDPKRDRAKGKTLANHHPFKFLAFLIQPITLALFLLFPLVQCDAVLAAYVATVWLVSLLYSFTRRLVVVNNLIVAFMAVAPLMCGMIHHHSLHVDLLLAAVGVAGLIFSREILKDLEDCERDYGWKRTIPVQWGRSVAVVVLLVISCLSISALAFSTIDLISFSALLFVPVLPLLVSLLARPDRAVCAKRMLDIVLLGILSASLLATF